MRMYVMAVIAAFSMTAPAIAQPAANRSIPAEIGNRANGYDYQPTPSEVRPREESAGIRPPVAQQKATDRDLEQMDKALLREQGLSTSSVPKMTTGQ